MQREVDELSGYAVGGRSLLGESITGKEICRYSSSYINDEGWTWPHVRDIRRVGSQFAQLTHLSQYQKK